MLACERVKKNKLKKYIIRSILSQLESGELTNKKDTTAEYINFVEKTYFLEMAINNTFLWCNYTLFSPSLFWEVRVDQINFSFIFGRILKKEMQAEEYIFSSEKLSSNLILFFYIFFAHKKRDLLLLH